MKTLPGRLALTILLAALAWPGAAAQPFEVRILATDPGPGAALHRGDAVSVRLGYRAASPVRFQIEAYLDGVRVAGAHSNPMPAYPPGEGDAIVWLAFRERVAVDEVRVQVMDQQWRVLDTLAAPLAVRWDGQPARAPAVSPEWVSRLNDTQQALVRADAVASSSSGGLGTVLVMLMGWSIPGYLALQVYALIRYRNGWRRAAMVPLILMVPLLGYTVFAFLAGSNLWPLFLLFLAPVAFIYLAAVGLLKRARA